MANLPDTVELVRVEYEYVDGRQFSVEGEELEKLQRNEKRAHGCLHMHGLLHNLESFNWTEKRPKH